MAQPQVPALAASGTSAVFLVLTVDPSEAAAARVRDVCTNAGMFAHTSRTRAAAASLGSTVRTKKTALVPESASADTWGCAIVGADPSGPAARCNVWRGELPPERAHSVG